MPHLLAARFESIGHRDARLDGLVLDFTHRDSACDSVLWLRNGGGKSSILNLLFSILRPSQHEFLGTGAEGKLRELRDYVAPDEVGQICLEWELDGPQGATPPRLFTGVCVDQRSSDGQPFKRLWYAVRVPSAAQMRIRDLPLLEIGSNGRKRVLRPTALRDRLTELNDGETTATVTDVQRDWEKLLISFGIDPAVFRYQLEMNKREGAADDLFRFGSSEEFADFILDMVLDPSAADEVGRRLADLRYKLARRPELEAEHVALEATGPRLRHLVQLAETRRAARERTSSSVRAATELEATLAAGISTKLAAEAEANEIATREQMAHNTAAGRRHNGTWTLEVYEWKKAELECADAKDKLKIANEAETQANRQKALVDLAPTLNRIDAVTAERAERNQVLEATLEKNKPLLEELGAAARAFVAALDAELEALAVRNTTAQGRLDEATNARLIALAARAREIEALGGVKAQRAAAQSRLNDLTSKRNELVANGTLQEDESAKKALQRHTRAAEAEALRVKEQGDRATALDRQATLDDRARAEAATSSRLAGERRRSLEEAIAEAQRTLAELARNPNLQAAIEDSNPDLLRLMPQALSRLSAARAQMQEQLVVAGIEAQLDQRALTSLTGKQALLPPSVDAERVQVALKAAGLNAFTAGAYLADNLAADRAEARIRSHPELAAGVIVDKEDLDSARSVLGGLTLVVEGPVAVGTTTDLLSTAPERIVVVPPKASFDRASAVSERERRIQRDSERRSRVEALRGEQAAVDAVAARLRDWGEQHPGAWFDDRRREAARNHSAELEFGGTAADLERKVTETTAEARLAREEQTAAIVRERAARDLAARVQSFIASGGAELDELARAMGQLSIEIDSTASRIANLTDEIATHEATIDATREDLRIWGDQKQDLEAERRSASESAKGPAGAPVPLAVARERFHVRSEQVSREVGAGALRAQVETLSKELERRHIEFEEELRQHVVSEPDVRQALELATSTTGIEEARRRAALAVNATQKRLVEATAHLKVTEKEVKTTSAAVEHRRTQRRVVEDIAAGCAGWPLERFEEEVPRIRADVEAATTEEVQAKTRWEEAQRRVRDLEAHRKGLEALRPRVQDALKGVPEGLTIVPTGELVPIDGLAQAEERVRCDVESLQQAIKALRTAELKANHAVSELNSFIREDAQAKLPSQLKDKLADPNADQVLVRAADFAVDVEKRAATIRDELASIDQHRKVVAQSLQTVTDPALRVLKRLEPASVFPSSVAVWGSSPFVRVRIKEPETVAERDAIASTLVDQLVALGEVPSGLKLVKRLVRDLVGPNGLRIDILKPEPVRRLLYEPVEHLGKFSRGEQLTAAILLYCTLAQQRAISRGGGRAPTSVLILDNPLGTCSNPQLVELQRSMAKVHGVQLIYTTGIEDLEALAQLPNIVRLKNASVDVRGRRHVSHDEDRLPMQSARVALEESN